jgi:hypothetical protein
MPREIEAEAKVGGYIFIESPQDREPYGQLPVPVMKDGRLSGGARFLYAVLWWCGWRQEWRDEPGYHGQQALAEEFSLSERTVRTYLQELRDAGYIQIERVGLGQPDNIILRAIK